MFNSDSLFTISLQLNFAFTVHLGFPMSIAHLTEGFLGGEQSYMLVSALSLWSSWSEEIFSITKLFSVQQYSNMPWVNTSEQGRPVGVTLKRLTLWLHSWCEGLERLATFNIWTSGNPPHQAALCLPHIQTHRDKTPHIVISLSPTHLMPHVV